MLTLYHHGSSVCAAKVRLVLHDKGAEWEGEYLDILKGEQFTPEYVAINPNAVVPTLIDDGAIIIESTVICEYLDEKFAAPSLQPPTPLGRAAMRLWTKRVDEKLHPMTSVLTYVCSHRHSILEGNSPEQVQKIINETSDPVKRARKREWIELGLDAPSARVAVKEFAETLAAMEQTLAGQPWLAGDTYSLADVALTPYLNRLRMLQMEGFWENLPAVADWFDRIRARPSFEPAVISWIPEPLSAGMARNGDRSWPKVRDMLAAV